MARREPVGAAAQGCRTPAAASIRHSSACATCSWMRYSSVLGRSSQVLGPFRACTAIRRGRPAAWPERKARSDAVVRWSPKID